MHSPPPQLTVQAAGLQPGPPTPPGLGVRPERYLGAHTPARPPRCASANPGAAPTPPPPGLFSCHQPSVAHFSSRELARRSEAPGKRPPSFPSARSREPRRRTRPSSEPPPAGPDPGLVQAARVEPRPSAIPAIPAIPAIGEREWPSPAGGRAAAPGASGPRGAAVTRLGPTASREGGREGGGSGGLNESVRQPSRREPGRRALGCGASAGARSAEERAGPAGPPHEA